MDFFSSSLLLQTLMRRKNLSLGSQGTLKNNVGCGSGAYGSQREFMVFPYGPKCLPCIIGPLRTQPLLFVSYCIYLLQLYIDNCTCAKFLNKDTGLSASPVGDCNSLFIVSACTFVSAFTSTYVYQSVHCNKHTQNCCLGHR